MRYTPRRDKPIQDWNRRFAFAPRRLDDGAWVWLETYERQWQGSSAGGFWRTRVDDSFEGLLP